ncbi:hypothetical protein [Nocardia abscessus]|uniref:hypothetical protein n=1 Tax=Nocardia abscessus TaxID=120957 RepID=UPI00245629AE|nr:hypothetical protein [Nocardia abscessus]
MTRNRKKKARIRARMAKEKVRYTVAARRAHVQPQVEPAPADPSAVVVIAERQYRLDADIFNLTCVASTKRGQRCRNLIEIHGQAAKWDVHGRYRLDWIPRDHPEFWVKRYGSLDRLYSSYLRQRCKLHLDADVPDAVEPELRDIGPLVATPEDVIDTLTARVYSSLIHSTRTARDTVDLVPEEEPDPGSAYEAAAAGDLAPLLAFLARHRLPALREAEPANFTPDPDDRNAVVWMKLLEHHHYRRVTPAQIEQCLAANDAAIPVVAD